MIVDYRVVLPAHTPAWQVREFGLPAVKKSKSTPPVVTATNINTATGSIRNMSIKINRIKTCRYGCKDGMAVYVDQEGYDCPIPCPNCK